MWQPVVKNLVWCKEDFFSAETLNDIDVLIKSMNEWKVKSSDEKPLITPSNFHYMYDSPKLNNNSNIIVELRDGFNDLFSLLGENPFPNPPFKFSQFMIKYFENSSNYDLHTESESKFGEWVYVVYLSDESCSQIQFLSESDVDEKMSLEEYNNWKNMREVLLSEGQPIYYSNKTVEIFPKKNCAIAFRTGVVHRILKYEESKKGRYSLTGWPFAKFS